MEGDRQEVERDIERHVSEALARFGVAGHVEIDGRSARLIGNGPPATAPLGLIDEDWPRLNPELRRRHATELARRLVLQRRASLQPAAETPRKTRSGWVLGGLLAVVIGVGLLLRLRDWLRTAPLTSPAPPPTASSPSDESERLARTAQVCEATRDRVARGATVGPTDVEGWVVVLDLLRPGDAAELRLDPALREFVGPTSHGEALLWSDGQRLDAGLSPATLQFLNHAGPDSTPYPWRWQELRLTLSGQAVDRYFRESQRAVLVRLAATLADRLRVSHGALYAHCRHQPDSRHLGSWFRGPTPGGAAAMLLYTMGGTAASPGDRAEQKPSGVLLDQFLRLTEPLTRARLGPILGRQDGMLAGPNPSGARLADGGKNPVTPSVVTFPFRDGSRASRSAMDLARYVGWPRQGGQIEGREADSAQ